MLLHFILFTESDLEYRFLIANDQKRSKEALYPPSVLEMTDTENSKLVFNKTSLTFQKRKRRSKAKV
ncbi:MAG: hypothetical protein H7259_00555 [Cytophagales bacterium]|nr:hypothetical protein [Cytophaga sp.]